MAELNNYNALQLFVKRPYGKHLIVNSGFTWAKDLTDVQDARIGGQFAGNPIQNAYDLSAEYGNNGTYPRRDFFAQVIYTLPVGKGQPFLGNSGKIEDILLGGWRIAWVIEKRSGLFFHPDPVRV